MFNKISSYLSNLFGTNKCPNVTFLTVLQEHLNTEAVTNKLTQKTIEKHLYQFNNIKDWLQKSGLTDLLVNEVKLKHMEALRFWLHDNIKSCSLDHSSRHLRLCRSACDYAVSREYMEYNRITSVKLRRSPTKDIVSLDVTDIKKFEGYYCKEIPQRNEIRDLFLFQCYTGLSYMDLWLFNIVEDRGAWITCQTGRGKTKKVYWAEFSLKAKRLLDKYNGVLPHISNQTYNRSIKKIAVQLGVKKTLTTHTGRKTFATLKRHEGYSIPAISGMLGNTEEVTRKHYVSPGKELIMTEMKRVKSGNAA